MYNVYHYWKNLIIELISKAIVFNLPVILLFGDEENNFFTIHQKLEQNFLLRNFYKDHTQYRMFLNIII